jgi:hypothetical protein
LGIRADDQRVQFPDTATVLWAASNPADHRPILLTCNPADFLRRKCFVNLPDGR